MNGNMTATQLVDTLKARGNQLLKQAESIQSVISEDSASGSQPSIQITVEDIKTHMGDKKFRSVQLADHFRVPVEELNKVLVKENGFTLGKQGWYSVSGRTGKAIKQKVAEITPVSAPTTLAPTAQLVGSV